MKKQIAIIGAGVSGLLACKYTLSKGLQPIVFEAKSSLGGVWTKTVETTKLQTPKPLYQFSDFPWPDSVTEAFPDQSQVFDYLQSYASHFDLLRHIKFNAKVIGISYEGPSDEEMESWSLWGGNGEAFSSRGKWKVEVQDTQTLSSEIYQVEFAILCVGRFSDVPNVPEFPIGKGPEAFHGEVIHAMDYTNMDYETARNFLKGKRVAVVGFQKFALDIAMECSAVNGIEHPCRVLYKTAHWNLPDYLPWGVPLTYLYLNRLAELLLHKPGEGFLFSLLATILTPLRWAFSKFVESHVKHKFPLKKFGMVPKHSFLQELNSCLIATVPEKFYDKVEEGSIILTKAPSFSFTKVGIIIDGHNQPLETDLVILATGFKGEKKLKDIFVSKTFQECFVGSPNAALPLYRECINPRIPQLAVIGFSESISNLYTSEIRCRWLAELLDGRFKIPSIKEMEKDVEKWDKFKKRYAGPYYKRSCIGGLHIWYNDQLCKDMGWNSRRKKGFLAELFEPYGPMDYVSP
ncbi:probable flavin-containing monooxygenase 1 [Ricinus communis]|uniref:Flavin-containing monooxygenase n=1 Tax=Ricinus communis TaxID=3988 RepID=B9SMR1_RICCO|nr:probable flavin-containing monooxygenase 1 [Ricinus communis]EEF35124.1 dimethylaniline monooxygenase, putative [Ricinus communis]|eukprot:XP_002527280.1 probable flavin-containing monooxygenase 1 [Ricinus communis]